MELLKTILGNITPLIALVLGILYFILTGKRKPDPSADLAAVTRIKGLLRACVTEIVTRMQQKYGENAGAFKLAGAINELLQLIPEQYKADFNEDVLQDIVEEGLDAAKALWKINPTLIGSATDDAMLLTAAETVPPAVIEALQSYGMHLEVADNGLIFATPNNSEACEPAAEP